MARKGKKKGTGRVGGMTNKLSVGIDLGEAESVATMFSPMGELVERFSFPMNDQGYSLFASKVPKDARLGFEACGTVYPVYRAFKGLGYDDLTVAHPKELKWIVKSHKKNDKVDSEKIARLLMVDMLPKSYLLTREEQIERDLLVQRVKLGAETRRTKNSIISYLKREDVFAKLPETEDNFSVTRREAIDAVRFGDDRDLVVRTMMERLRFLEAQCLPLEERVRALVRDNEDVRLLMTIPGVDYYLASLISSYIRDVKRFPSFDHLASFFGIIPESADSANVKRRGKMSKDGPSIARWALGIMTDTVMERNGHLHAYYVHEKERTKSGKYAHVLTMKKTLRMVYHVLRTREHWRWENEKLTQRKLANLEKGGGNGIA